MSVSIHAPWCAPSITPPRLRSFFQLLLPLPLGVSFEALLRASLRNFRHCSAGYPALHHATVDIFQIHSQSVSLLKSSCIASTSHRSCSAHDSAQSLTSAPRSPTLIILRALSIGLQEFHNRLRVKDGGQAVDGKRLMDADHGARKDVQDAISRFYTGRIGVRFLVEHHVSTMPPVCAELGACVYVSRETRSHCSLAVDVWSNVVRLGRDDSTHV